MKAKLFLILLFFGGIITNGNAQNKWQWPDDPGQRAIAEEKNVIYTDLMKSNDFKGAAKPLSWLLKNTPDLNPSIYINGAKIYETIAQDETDETKKVMYQDSALLMYDLRIQYFDDEAKVLNRKAYTAYKYFTERETNYEELYDIFEETFDLNRNDVLNNNLLAYMDVIRRYQGVTNSLSDEEILAKYDQISDIIDHKINMGKHVEMLKKVQGSVDDLLSELVEVDCDFVVENLGPDFQENPEDVDLAKKIFKRMLTGKCTDLPLFMEAAKTVQKAEPTFGLAKVIGQKCAVEKNYDCAMAYFEEALNLTEENTKKAEIYIELGDIAMVQGQNSTAKNYYVKAINTDPTQSAEAYNKIGHMYFRSFEGCRGNESIVRDRAIYIAAYEMFRKAGNSSAMSNAKAQFPSMEEIFTEGYEVGQSITIGCWINETVSIQKR